jgi:putative ubiquitin-RnfH superfamily antitoxin RatB of RatAB toxin-antitoxin module
MLSVLGQMSAMDKGVSVEQMIHVEVAYALPDEQKIVTLKVESGCTAYEAVVRSKIVEYFPQIDPDHDPMGIFGKAIKDPKAVVLADGQRVEIYRPLLIDPKAARANRAAKAKVNK